MSSRAFFFVLLAVVLTFPACDKLNNVREKITSSGDKPKAAKVSAPATPAAESVAVPADALVTVNGWSMTKSDFADKLKALKAAMPEFDITNKQQNRQILDRLVEQRLFVQEAERRGIDKNKDVRLALDEFRNTLLVQQLAAQVAEGVEATDQEVQDFYNANSALFVKEGEWKVREIVVADEAAARQISDEIAKGADFAQTAQQKSKGKTAAQGGDLGALKTFAFPQMANAVLALNVGSVSAAVAGPEGFYIFKLEEKKGGEPLTLDEIKNDLKAELGYQKKEKAVVDFLGTLRAKDAIQINEKLLEE
jgi:peptidyl-prolyl cis-trans isomerase C